MIVEMHGSDFITSICIVVGFAILSFVTFTILFNTHVISITAQSLEIDLAEPTKEESLDTDESEALDHEINQEQKSTKANSSIKPMYKSAMFG